MVRSDTLPNVDECIKGRIYKLRCRNLSYGVWNGRDGFIGIRQKWYDRFLDTEYHYDVSKFHGTVADAIDTGIDVPDDIPIKAQFGAIDEITRRPVYFDKPVADGGRGWCFKDTDESDQSIKPMSLSNTDLFQFLDKFIKELPEDKDDDV